MGLLALLLQISCSDSDTPIYPPGQGPTGTPSLCEDDGGPAVTILQPTAPTDLTAAQIVTESSVIVQCQVDSTGDPIDDSSVVIRVNGVDDATVTPAIANRGDGLFEATADVSSFPNGMLQVTCEASDAGPRGPCTAASVETFVDLGPVIQMIFPSASGSVFSGGMTVLYSIALSPVSEDDTGLSALSDIPQTVVAGQSIATALEAGSQDTFSAPVDFDDPMLYVTPLDGNYQLIVNATNQRGVTRTETIDFTVDADGPTITIEEPTLGEVVGGTTDVVATISDSSGIDPTQVSFYIGANQFEMEPVAGSTTQFRGSFDANQYPASIGEVDIFVVAVDSAGNETAAFVSVELDVVPPQLSLDPPMVREGQEEDALIQCSTQFDPVGPSAISRGDIITPISFIRARVEDRGNVSASFKSGLDQQSVQVWILDDASQALVIDTDGDPNNFCDALNPDILPGNAAGNTPAVAIDLLPIAPTGTAYYSETETFPPQYSFCSAGDASSSPDPVCDGFQLTRVCPDNREPSGTIPAIFSKGPILPVYCIGDPWDWQTALSGSEGPACMVVTAQDERGNFNVSEPIEVCFSATFGPLPDGHPCLGFNPDSFNCSDGCVGDEFRENELIGPFN